MKIIIIRPDTWANALREACDRLAKLEYLIEKGKKPTYIPNANEATEISIRSTIIFTDIMKRNGLNQD